MNPAGRRWLKAAATVFGIGATLYLVAVILLAIFQRDLIYQPPPGRSQTPAGFELVRYRTADGLDLTGGFLAPRSGKPTLLFFHGNAADWQSDAVAVSKQAAEGYGVLAAEYRGYQNPGQPSEQGLYRDARAAYNWLRKEGIPANEIIVVGNSLGSGVAVQLASETHPAALILISPFASLARTASQQIPWTPTGLFLRDRYDNLSKIKRVETPLAIIHGTSDMLIPIGEALLLAQASKRGVLVEIPGAGHDLVFKNESQEAFDRSLKILGIGN